MKVQILGSGCPNCKRLEANVREALQALGINAEIEKVKNIDDIVSFGVMMTPALAIDGVVKSTGRVLSKEEIMQLLKQ